MQYFWHTSKHLSKALTPCLAGWHFQWPWHFPSSIYQHVPPEPWGSFQRSQVTQHHLRGRDIPSEDHQATGRVSSGHNLCQWPPHYTSREVMSAGHKAIFFPEFVSSLRASSLRLLPGCKGSLFFSTGDFRPAAARVDFAVTIQYEAGRFQVAGLLMSAQQCRNGSYVGHATAEGGG